MDIHAHIARRLRRRRRLLNLTQEAVGKFLGVRFQQVQKYESGANHISAERLWQLSQALHVPVSYFFEGLEADEMAS